MIEINIKNETAPLRAVVVGTANDFGGTPAIEECYDPKSKEHIQAGSFPNEKDCVLAMDSLIGVFEKHHIMVYRPSNIEGLNQIFSRDIAFVIEDKLILPNIIEERRREAEGISYILNQVNESDKIKMPEGARIEGGDVMLCNDYIFVGYSEKEDFERYRVARTNRAGLDFLATTFSNKKVMGLELKKSDNDPRKNALHLDCCFQPIGRDMAILYKGGFKNNADFNFLINYFGKHNIIEVSREEMYNMNPNVFSISEKIIISEKGFSRLNSKLRKRGFIVEEISYAEIAKMSGLFRCSTMPLIRE